MGTIAEKLTYLNGTKSSLKTAINNLGGNIDNNTTFRQYANVLNDIYDNLPKVSDTGTNVSLNPTLKGRLGIVPKGNTYQESTTGKNLLIPNTNKNATTSNGITYTPVYDGEKLLYVNVNGTATADSSYLIQNQSRLDIDNTKSYIVNGCPSGGSQSTYNIIIYYYDENSTYLGGVYDTGNGRTIPTASKILTNIYIRSGTQVNNLKFYPMLRLSNVTDDTYEPYTNGASPNPNYPQEIQSATGTQKVVVSGKNKLPNEQTTQTINGITFTINNDKSVTMNGTATATTDLYFAGTSNQYVDLDLNAGIHTLSGCTSGSGTTYMLFAVQNRNGTLSYYQNQTTGINITTQEEDTFRIFIRVLSGQTVNNVTIYPQLEQGSTATPYQPYQEPQEVDIELNNIELNKIGTYEDYIGGTPDNWVLYKNIGKVVLDGSESWYQWGTDTFYITRLSTIRNALSSYYKYNSTATGAGQLNNGEFFIHDSTNNNVVIFRNTSITTVADFKTWLSTHNTEVLYVLAETQQTPITDTNLVSQLNELYYLQSYNDTTNIDVTGNLPMRITASAIKGA